MLPKTSVSRLFSAWTPPYWNPSSTSQQPHSPTLFPDPSQYLCDKPRASECMARFLRMNFWFIAKEVSSECRLSWEVVRSADLILGFSRQGPIAETLTMNRIDYKAEFGLIIRRCCAATESCKIIHLFLETKWDCFSSQKFTKDGEGNEVNYKDYKS